MLKLTIASLLGAIYADAASGLQYLSSLIYFIIAGNVPGTNIVLSPDTMLGIWAGILAFATIGGVTVLLVRRGTRFHALGSA